MTRSRAAGLPRSAGPEVSRLLDAVRRLDEPPAWTNPSVRDEFTHDDATRRAVARSYCDGCPVLVECLAAGRAERAFGVWGGLDLDPTRPITRPDDTTTREDTTT